MYSGDGRYGSYGDEERRGDGGYDEGGYGGYGGGRGEHGHHGHQEHGYGRQGYGGVGQEQGYGRGREEQGYGGGRQEQEFGGGRHGEDQDYQSGAQFQRRPTQPVSESEQLVKIYCAANPDYFLTVKGDELVLTPGDESNKSQQFVKDCKWGSRVQDEAGSPAFVIVHKASGLALQHGSESFDRVVLRPYDPNTLDESVLWTQSDDVGDGYQCLRPVGDIHLNLDVKGGDAIRSGAELILFKWKKQENQKWKIIPIEKSGGSEYGSSAYGSGGDEYGSSAYGSSGYEYGRGGRPAY